MPRVNLADVPEQESRTPRGKFHSRFRDVSVALGAPYGVGLAGGGHPFDVQVRRVPPGAAICPYHLHHAQWELFVVRAGEGTVRAPDGRHVVKTGDVFIHPPGAAHQLINTGTAELEVLIVTDNPPLDLCHYPDSNKWGGRAFGKIFRMTESSYLDGEEEPLPGVTPVAPPMPPPRPEPATFASRRVSIDAVPWDNFDSPKGKFRGGSKELSIALGAKRNTPTGLGGHPFDLELGKVPAGFSSCPYHIHSSQWELFIFLEGTGTVRTEAGTSPVGPGDVVLHPPGEAHQFTATTDLHYLLIADNPTTDIWRYPDIDKWGHNSPRKFFRATDVGYWDGLE